MGNGVKPTVVVSRCLGFDICRYDGEEMKDEFVETLKPYVNFITVCPEVGMGLGVPREPIRIVLYNGEYKLIQPSTGIEFTDRIEEFSLRFLEELEDVDGFILKSKSPSCGISDTKIFSGIYEEEPIKRGTGFFAREVKRRFPDIIIEDENRLLDSKVQREFLSGIYRSMSIRNNMEFIAEVPSELKKIL
jgi:uncharacterized protein YbbK (DUF523 family)